LQRLAHKGQRTADRGDRAQEGHRKKSLVTVLGVVENPLVCPQRRQYGCKLNPRHSINILQPECLVWGPRTRPRYLKSKGKCGSINLALEACKSCVRGSDNFCVGNHRGIGIIESLATTSIPDHFLEVTWEFLHIWCELWLSTYLLLNDRLRDLQIRTFPYLLHPN